MIGATPALSRLVVGQQAGRIPTMSTEFIASPLDGFIPLLCEIGGVGGVRQLDADSGVISVAHVPAQAVLGHRVVNGRAVKLHHVMHSVGVIMRPQQSVVVGARAGVRRLVDDEVARIEVAVPVAHVLIDALVRLGSARGGEGSDEREDDCENAAEPYPAPTDIVFGICHLTSLVE